MTHEQEDIERALEHLMTAPFDVFIELLKELQQSTQKMVHDADQQLPATVRVNPNTVEWMSEDAAEPESEPPGELEFSKDEFVLMEEVIEE